MGNDAVNLALSVGFLVPACVQGLSVKRGV